MNKMQYENIMKLLGGVKDGTIDISDAASELQKQPFTDIGYAKIDNHRSVRSGHPEVIFCEGKAPEHIQGIVKNMMDSGVSNIMGTRASEDVYKAVAEVCGEENVIYHKLARIVTVAQTKWVTEGKKILVISGGTSDIPIAEEAKITARVMGQNVDTLYDVGVAGIHRLLSNLDILLSANVIIAVAGMEGALASVVGGLVDKPVIAVPTSIGYGANFGGVAALLAMLNSCASGITVVNIDNGFGAGYAAALMNRL